MIRLKTPAYGIFRLKIHASIFGRFRTRLSGRHRLQTAYYISLYSVLYVYIRITVRALTKEDRSHYIHLFPYIPKCNIPEKAMNNRPSNIENIIYRSCTYVID